MKHNQGEDVITAEWNMSQRDSQPLGRDAQDADTETSGKDLM